MTSTQTVDALHLPPEALDHLEASRVSLVVAVTPLITLSTAGAGAALFPGYLQPEEIGALGLAGAGLVVAGTMLASFFQSRPAGARGKAD